LYSRDAEANVLTIPSISKHAQVGMNDAEAQLKNLYELLEIEGQNV